MLVTQESFESLGMYRASPSLKSREAQAGDRTRPLQRSLLSRRQDFCSTNLLFFQEHRVGTSK